MTKADLVKCMQRMPEFKRRGTFYIGRCNADVISGYCLDMSPGFAYVWRFILPAYDDLKSLHMTLGSRILRIKLNSDEFNIESIQHKIIEDWQALLAISDRNSFLAFLDAGMFGKGIYANWARFLTLIRKSDFASADILEKGLDAGYEFSQLPAIEDSYRYLSEARKSSGWTACEKILNSWSESTNRLYGGLPAIG